MKDFIVEASSFLLLFLATIGTLLLVVVIFLDYFFYIIGIVFIGYVAIYLSDRFSEKNKTPVITEARFPT